MLVLKIHRKVSAQGFQGVSFTDTLRVHTRACSAVLCWTTANHRYPECTAGKVTPILFTWRKPKTETTSLKGEEETKPKTKEQTSEEFAFGLSSLDMSQVFIFHSVDFTYTLDTFLDTFERVSPPFPHSQRCEWEKWDSQSNGRSCRALHIWTPTLFIW